VGFFPLLEYGESLLGRGIIFPPPFSSEMGLTVSPLFSVLPSFLGRRDFFFFSSSLRPPPSPIWAFPPIDRSEILSPPLRRALFLPSLRALCRCSEEGRLFPPLCLLVTFLRQVVSSTTIRRRSCPSHSMANKNPLFPPDSEAL